MITILLCVCISNYFSLFFSIVLLTCLCSRSFFYSLYALSPFVSAQESTSVALHEIIKTLLTSKKITVYSTALKDFASTLLFYSMGAYTYVRNMFLKSLPHPRTVRRWLSKVDFSPGINQVVLHNIKKLIDQNAKDGKELQFGMQVDEMSIKRWIEWDGKMYHGVVDVGLNCNSDHCEEATYVWVFMLVCLNYHFKTPIAYYFIKSLSAITRANILQQNLLALHENGISTIRSVTFDGAITNISMVENLGANIKNINELSYFDHPVTKDPIVVILDACHMLKLIRNVMAACILIDKEGNCMVINNSFVRIHIINCCIYQYFYIEVVIYKYLHRPTIFEYILHVW